MKYLFIQRKKDDWQIISLTNISAFRHEDGKLLLPFYEPVSIHFATLCAILTSNRIIVKLYLNGTWE